MSFYFADAHGRSDLVLGLLEQVGLYTDGKRVRPEVFVGSLGDLGNMVGESVNDDRQALHLIERGVVDGMLCGNHEHPYFRGTPFWGFHKDPELQVMMNRLERRGGVVPAYSEGDILLTHAGLAHGWNLKEDSETLAFEFTRMWREGQYTHPFFDAIGQRRGGTSDIGGILWSDAHEKKSKLHKQIFGHTPGDHVRLNGKPVPNDFEGTLDKGDTLCIDLNCDRHHERLAGVWIEDGLVRVVVHEGERYTHGQSPPRRPGR